MGASFRAMSLVLCVVAITPCVACSTRAPLPASHVESSGEEDTLEPSVRAVDHPIRSELRALHRRCDDAIDGLEEGYEAAERREDALAAAAAVAYLAGLAAGGTSSRCVPTATGCTQPSLSRSAGEGGPIDQQTDQVYMEASDRIRAINRGLDAVDELVMEQPDPAQWSEARLQRWDELSGALSTACGGAPGG